MSTAANPKAPKISPEDAPQESTGPVASDSLAAESAKAGGAFSENENVDILSVKGANSTLNTTDTSGATVLHAASSGAEREKQDIKGLGSDERGTTGEKLYADGEQPKFSGTHSQEGYTGGTSKDTAAASEDSKTVAQSYSGASGDSFADGGAATTSSSSGSVQSTSVKSTGGSSSGPAPGTGSAAVGSSGSADSADAAPSYVDAVTGGLRTEGEMQPKGKDLTEGGIPETKTFTGNVGGDKDPGRLAEQKFEKINADTAGAAGQSAEEKQGNPFSVLGTERA